MSTSYTREPSFAGVVGIVSANVAYTLAAIAAGAEGQTTVPVPNMQPGDCGVASHTAIGATEVVAINVHCTTAGTAVVTITNLHATVALTGGAGTLNVVVFKMGQVI